MSSEDAPLAYLELSQKDNPQTVLAEQNQHNYKILNLIFLGVIGLVLLYAALFAPGAGRHPIPSSSEILGAGSTLSTGLSRSFSSIVRLNFDLATQFNPHGLRVFTFFLFQFLVRLIVLIFLVGRQKRPVGRFLVVCDANISLVLFVICFKPFWIEFFALWS